MPSPDLMNLLHDVPPYEGHDVAAHPGDMQGWDSTHPIFAAVIAALRPAIIVEVGSWKGASAIHMAQAARNLGLSTQIICIDTWLGSPEHLLVPSYRESLRPRNGYPQLYFTFLTNVIQHGLIDAIIPFPATSENAIRVLYHKQIRPDLVYIDAAHDYYSVKRDLQLYWLQLADHGMLLGDDYHPGWEVRQAADDFAREQGLQIEDCQGKFLLSKRPVMIRRTVAPRRE